ncbi:unnamed protein product, partial [Polarella glacialis]
SPLLIILGAVVLPLGSASASLCSSSRRSVLHSPVLPFSGGLRSRSGGDALGRRWFRSYSAAHALVLGGSISGSVRRWKWAGPRLGDFSRRGASDALEEPALQGRLAQLRREHRWDWAELLSACRTAGSSRSQTCVLIDRPLHASNVGSVLRQAAVLQGAEDSGSDAVSALLLSDSSGDRAIATEKFLKSVLRISLGARHELPEDSRTRLVVLPSGDPTWALQELRREGYILCALENREACSDGAAAPPAIALWDAPLDGDRVVFIAGGEDCGLSDDLLSICDHQCFVPGASCKLAVGKAERDKLGQVGQNPTLNLAHAVVIALYERRRQLCKARRRES